MLLAFWSGEILWASLAALAVGLGIGVTVPSLFASALSHAVVSMRGHSVGLLNTAIFLGSFISPLVFTPVATRMGYPALFWLAATITCALGFASLIWQRTRLRP